MKKIFLISLAIALMILGGCSYSASHDSKASVNVSTDGKVETSASSAIYTERVENGKTTNNSATVEVSNKGASANSSKGSSKESADGLSYTAIDADIRKGEAEIDGYFVNNGKNTVKISEVHVTLTFKDDKGKLIWHGDTVIKNLNIVVKPGEKEESNFIITGANTPGYDGSFDMDYNIEYL